MTANPAARVPDYYDLSSPNARLNQPMDALLYVQDLKVAYRSRERYAVVALNDVSFEVGAGEAIGLLGESGCGKTTLALTLLNVLPPSARVLNGAVVFGGTNLLELSEAKLQKIRGARISLVHQEPGRALNPVMRVGEQIAEVIRAHQSTSRGRSLAEAKSLLLQMGFEADSRIWEAYPHQLSGGQQQRVAIAQAVACRPALLIADEPTTALDPITQMEILALLKKLKEQFALAIIVISHAPEVLAGLVDRVLVMYAGHLIEQGPARDVLQQAMHPYTVALLRCRPEGLLQKRQRQLLPVIAGESVDLTRLPAGCAFEPRCSDRMEKCRTSKPARFSIEANRLVACFKYAP